MVVVNTHEAKTRLSRLLKLVEEQGECVRICRNGRPIADMGPVRKGVRNPLAQDPALTGVVFKESPMEPLSEDDWPEKQE